MNKKGSAQDILYMGMFMFLAILMIVIGSFVWMQWNAAWSSAPTGETLSKVLTARINSNWYGTFDFAAILFYFLLWIGTLAMAFFLDNSPAFTIVFVVLIVIFVITLIPLGLFLGALEDTPIGVVFANLPLTYFFISNWIAFIVMYSITTGVALYAKSRLTQ